MKLGLYPKIDFGELCLILLAWSFLNFRWMDHVAYFGGSYAVISLVISTWIIYWLKKIKKDPYPLFFLEKEHFLSVMVWVAVAALLIPLGYSLNMFTFSFSWHRILLSPLVFIGIVLTIGAVEELVFRQVLLVFVEQRFNIPVGIAISSILFGFSHIVRGSFPNWPYILVASLAGLIYGVVFWRYGLSYAIILHSLVDVFKYLFLAR